MFCCHCFENDVVYQRFVFTSVSIGYLAVWQEFFSNISSSNFRKETNFITMYVTSAMKLIFVMFGVKLMTCVLTPVRDVFWYKWSKSLIYFQVWHSKLKNLLLAYRFLLKNNFFLIWGPPWIHGCHEGAEVNFIFLRTLTYPQCRPDYNFMFNFISKIQILTSLM